MLLAKSRLFKKGEELFDQDENSNALKWLFLY